MALRSWCSLALVIALASCHASGRARSPRSSTISATTAAPTASTVFVEPPGKRVFSVQNVPLATGEWLTIALHPTEVQIGVMVSATTALEACPATINGSLVGGYWPGHNFGSCLPLDCTGRIALPSTHTHEWHVAFALRARTAGLIRTATINYGNGDSFLLIVPPSGRGDGMTVSFTPSSPTVGAQALAMPETGPPPGVQLRLEQGGRALTVTGPCNFPAELTSCFQGVQPNSPVTVTLRGGPPSSNTLGLYLEWLP